jgi:hypothetical protein
MSILFPFILSYKVNPNSKGNYQTHLVPLLVNPTDITVNKRSQIAEMRTLAGTIFQPWPNMPDEVTIKGIMYGTRSVLDFRTLQNVIDKRPDLKEVNLIYKWKTYSGYVKSLSIGAHADKPRVFDYDFVFVSKTPFSLPRMMLGQLTGYKNELDYLRDQLYGLKNSLTKDPITGAMNLTGLALASTTSIFDPTSYTEVQKVLSEPDKL